MTKRVELQISRENHRFTGALCLSTIHFRTTFKVSTGNSISQSRIPMDEWEQKQAGELATKAVTKFLEIEGCHYVGSGGAYELRVCPTTAMNDEEYKNFLRQAVAAFVEVFGPIDEFVLSKQVVQSLEELFSSGAVPSTDGDRVFVKSIDEIIPAATVN